MPGKDFISVEGARICPQVGLPPGCLEGVRIEYVSSRGELVRRIPGVPEWGVGAALPERNLVFIVRGGSPDKIERIIRHELAHIALRRKVGDIYIPRWFNEGVAEKIAGGMTFGEQVRLGWAVLFRGIIPLGKLEQVNTFDSEHAGLAYAEAADAVEFLQNFCPLAQLCDSIAKHRDFAEGFRAACGMSVYRFYRRWLAHLREKYFVFVVLGDTRFLWSLVGVFLLTAGMWSFIRQRRKMAELHRRAEEEGWSEPPEDFL